MKGRGVKYFVLSIDSESGSYLQKLYDDGCYIQLRNLMDLGDAVFQLLGNISQALK
jgi:hypothetical protein